MIRFVDNKTAEKEYANACLYDNVYGTINLSLYRLYHDQGLGGMFWNIFDADSNLVGNLSFVNDTFTICVKDEKCTDEVAEFINFWHSFSNIKYDYRKLKKLYSRIDKRLKLTFGDTFCFSCAHKSSDSSAKICKVDDIYSFFSLMCAAFPESMSDTDFSSFKYDMLLRMRRNESLIFGVVKDGMLASAVEVMSISDRNVVIGALATDEKYRKRGFASSLLNNVADEFKDKTCYIQAADANLSRFYSSLGFKKYSEWAQICAE